ncbi:cytochrome c3 family protein [Oceanibacterium hippocampi]|uniref:Class III cytochrome C family protein n=1 Tax=Oceanibacterium hippocampi TaxID=745714 RepID=A0A1Y5TCD9_9PROT|nr:cytochrome c3 family protein [Oceanibacterium hippocampi]SLN57276.1 Class III cytochrome C family protein [Oceanibacterium hippocampi]
MDALISQLTRKRSGDVARRDTEVTTDILRIGRGADCQVYLPDPRVPLLHSEIHERAGGFYLESVAADLEASVNGASVSTAQLKKGDKIGVGPYELVIEELGGDRDIGITIELVRPLGATLDELKERSRTSVNSVLGLGRRGWSWLLFIAIAVIFLGGPIYAFYMKAPEQRVAFDMVAAHQNPKNVLTGADSLWLSGGMSSPHRFFGADCEACHQEPFVQVQDQACVNCHKGISHHANPTEFTTATFAGEKCQSCHKEHNGIREIVLNDQAFCVDCHAGLDAQEPKTTLLNVSDFGNAHPNFRPTVVQDAEKGVFARLRLEDKPKEMSNLKFPHDKHLAEKGVRHPVKGTINMDCGDCHVTEPGGVGMKPIKMEENCIECHRLAFDPSVPDRWLPHGKPVNAIEQIREFYAKAALEGAYQQENSSATNRRRLPGQRMTEEERVEALEWAQQKAETVATTTFGKSLCGSCHTVTEPAPGGDGFWQIAQVRLADTWLPKGTFDHGKHRDLDCVSCHAAPTSKTAEDVLLPNIDGCQGCHGGEKAADLVPSTCIDCHEFHLPGLPELKPVQPAKQAALKAETGKATGN